MMLLPHSTGIHIPLVPCYRREILEDAMVRSIDKPPCVLKKRTYVGRLAPFACRCHVRKHSLDAMPNLTRRFCVGFCLC
jgi:hypothetical protein